MAIRSILSTLIRSGGDKLSSATWRRLISSVASSTYKEEKPPVKTASTSNGRRSLKSGILGFKLPTEITTEVLQEWVDSGHRIKISELRFISKSLLRFKRYNQALQIWKWLETQKGLQLSAFDHATILELLIKVQGLTPAEEYFDGLPNTASKKAACVPLLHGYVEERNIEKAEALMSKLTALGLALNSRRYNEMMKLYMATSHYEKVPLVMEQMTRNKIPIDYVSYNLWMEACAKLSGVAEAEAICGEMRLDGNVTVGWSTLATLANIYIKAGLVEKAVAALKNAESMLSKRNRLPYTFLMTQYATLNHKDGVLRLWEASKEVGTRITCADYICILSCLVKLGDLVEAGRVFREWESNCQNYDIRVSNVLLGAYMRDGWVEKAELLHLHTLEKGGCPNYKTWEILAEGWVRSHDMVKAINAMRNGLPMLKDCHLRPSQSILLAIAEYFEKEGNLGDANNFFRDILGMGLASSPIYKSLLRMHLSAERPAHDILEMMDKDKIEMDDEISTLVQEKQAKLTPEIDANANAT
ncbi:hypothetical protein COLO4_11967 [Corchorus olitorius]|uniref:Pentacotripeptide-repeat region of PRORP domain-containing protein n=1 Tax=Corchorus olitorius TaxID=93759 RepID=A0A1R3K2M6_9ROSI|nr:hypothetical protein COLO4_11967 [Corchorus olitorius]